MCLETSFYRAKTKGSSPSVLNTAAVWKESVILDCKTVVFFPFRKARNAGSVFLACEAREPHTPPSPFLHSLQTFGSNIYRVTCVRKKYDGSAVYNHSTLLNSCD